MNLPCRPLHLESHSEIHAGAAACRRDPSEEEHPCAATRARAAPRRTRAPPSRPSASNTLSRILPLVAGVHDLGLDAFKLPLRLLAFPELPNVCPRLAEGWICTHPGKPFRQLWEVLHLVEDPGPLKDSREHELHKNASRIPSHVCDRQFLPRHVGALHVFLQPIKLLPDLSELGGACCLVHAALRFTPLRLVGGQVHRALGVRKSWLRAIRRGDVKVVDAAKQLDEGTALRSRWAESWTLLAILVLQVIQDHRALKHGRALLVDEGRDLLQRVDTNEVLCLQICIGDQLCLDAFLKPLLLHPDSDPSRVVGVDHVEEDRLRT
mmetsp:Transcript_27696/g.69529  ORF Transcript_27696/g.69529 Transcript_27696/m.69529 type:complete len:323 (+) Transcript_27696:47-1015(+)